MDISALKSGTDLRGKADGDDVVLTEERAAAAARAFAFLLKEKTGKEDLKIAVGHDSRRTGPKLAFAVENALSLCGCEVFSVGMCSTPSMFMMTQFKETDCDGSIMITASHHPADRNGMKFFSKSGGVNAYDLDSIITYAREEKKVVENASKVRRGDYMKLYTDFLIERAKSISGKEKPLSGMKICVDAGGGAGGFFASEVLLPLGADVSSSQFLEPDGDFTDHIPNPENKTAMSFLSRRVVEAGADMGIIFDADVDRAAIASEDGEEINRNRLIAVIAAVYALEGNVGTIVTDSVTSSGLKEFLSARSITHRRFKRGYRNVIDEALRLEGTGINVPAAVETSGHAALKENCFLDDGAYLSLRLALKAAELKNEGKTLKSLISDLKEPVESAEARLKVNTPLFKEASLEILRELESVCLQAEKKGKCLLARDSCEGVRADLVAANGFFIARASVHDPVIVVNIESEEKGGIKKAAKFLSAFFGAYSLLDSFELTALSYE